MFLYALFSGYIYTNSCDCDFPSYQGEYTTCLLNAEQATIKATSCLFFFQITFLTMNGFLIRRGTHCSGLNVQKRNISDMYNGMWYFIDAHDHK